MSSNLWLPTFRDWRESRDWARPWRDPPGHYPCADCCGGCTPACTPACPSGGSVGSESGSECSDCASVIITDSFTSTLDSAWVGAGSCVANGIHPTFGAHIDSDQLHMGSGGSAIKRPFDRPELSGFCVQVKLTLIALPTAGVCGFSLARGRYFIARPPASSDYARHSCTDADGCIGAGSSFVSGIASSPTTGDVMEMIFRDEGGADGICSVCYQINGTTVRVEEGVQFCFDCEMWVAILSTGANAKFDDLEVRTS